VHASPATAVQPAPPAAPCVPPATCRAPPAPARCCPASCHRCIRSRVPPPAPQRERQSAGATPPELRARSASVVSLKNPRTASQHGYTASGIIRHPTERLSQRALRCSWLVWAFHARMAHGACHIPPKCACEATGAPWPVSPLNPKPSRGLPTREQVGSSAKRTDACGQTLTRPRAVGVPAPGGVHRPQRHRCPTAPWRTGRERMDLPADTPRPCLAGVSSAYVWHWGNTPPFNWLISFNWHASSAANNVYDARHLHTTLHAAPSGRDAEHAREGALARLGRVSDAVPYRPVREGST
jgi:hypothetical protein